jgi:hypothetical protein
MRELLAAGGLLSVLFSSSSAFSSVLARLIIEAVESRVPDADLPPAISL